MRFHQEFLTDSGLECSDSLTKLKLSYYFLIIRALKRLKNSPQYQTSRIKQKKATKKSIKMICEDLLWTA